FSSRRRHTWFSRDWSSDVCSSDLEPEPPADRAGGEIGAVLPERLADEVTEACRQRTGSGRGFVSHVCCFVSMPSRPRADGAPGRSEERRVGKESRYKHATDELRDH